MLKIMRFIQKTINTRVTPLAYLFALWQVNFGLNMFFADRRGGDATVLSQIEPLVPSEYWGLALGLIALVLILGMIMKSERLVQVTAFGGFSLWVMAGIAYALEGYIWLHTIGAVIMVLMFGYYFLAAGLDQLWDYAPNRLE